MASPDVERPTLIGPTPTRGCSSPARPARIAAVPDLTGGFALGDGQAREEGRLGRLHGRARCDGDPSMLVPALQAAAGLAGYQWVVAPWSPDPDAAPETIHARFTMSL